jgi:sugar lactone lactonase YvrE
MVRRLVSLVSVAAVGSTLVLWGCGDPLSIVGDIPGLMRIVVGIPESPGQTAEEQATRSRIRGPNGIVLDDSGVLFVADGDNGRVLSVTSSGALTVISDNSSCTPGPCLVEPADIALDADGRLIVADPAGHRVWRFTPTTGESEIIAGTGVSGSSPDGSPAAGSALAAPYGVAVGVDGLIYVSESHGARVRTIRPDGSLGTVAGTGEAGYSGDGGGAISAQLDFPLGLDLVAGSLYVTDTGNQRIRVVDLEDGRIRTVAGSGLRGFSGDGGEATSASLAQPADVAVSADERQLYIADTSNHRIRLVNLDTGRIETYAGTGNQEYSGDLLDAGATSLSRPGGVATSPFGLLFISDPGHAVVWRVALEI